jgi:hypothetical protein
LNRTYGVLVKGQAMQLSWQEGDAPHLDSSRRVIYLDRISSSDLFHLLNPPTQPSDVALRLPHEYFYIIPLGLAECYHALGDWSNAEKNYFLAASYQFLNTVVEAPYLWLRLATLYLDWGNALFSSDQAPDAFVIYQHVLMQDGSVPNSTLYSTVSLKPGADAGSTVIANLQDLINSQSGPAPAPVPAALAGINPQVSAVILDVHQQLIKIQNGLDFLGHWHAAVPIWTFDYLQNAAINFTQLAMNAERDFINFQERADTASLTRQQIAQGVTQAQAEAKASQMQAAAADAEVTAFADGVALAQKRAKDADDNAAEYAITSQSAIIHQALSAQLSGGDDGNSGLLNGYADAMMGIGPMADFLRNHPDWHLSGSGPTLSAAEQLASSRLNREYEVDSLQRQSQEMHLAETQAKDELNAANARSQAAWAGAAAAQLRAANAQQDLAAFDAQFFTPDVWYRMANTMYQLYRRYLSMSLRIARLMQQAYNFETDQQLQIIKSDYSTVEVQGLLAAEALMADIQSFTYDLITSRSSKPQPIRQTISLAERYGYLFETQLRKSGVMEFDTRIDDFDSFYPGTYAGRIEAIEVEVDGIVPVAGISGTLTNSGISAYRTPSSLWADPEKSGLKYRVQSRETLVLSEYNARQDSLIIQNDERMMRIFQGAGLASTWRLELPPSINDIDYGSLTDVRITFYYKARYDPDLHDRVLVQLASRPAVNSRQKGLPLRWLYPDAFFHFQDTGELSITLSKSDFRRNETNPILTGVSILVATDGSVPPSGLKLSLATPLHAAISSQTDTSGVAASEAGNPWEPLVSGTALGTYTLAMTAGDNPALVKNGSLDLSPITNIALVLEYSFTPRT